MERVDRLLEKPCYIIDFLPRQVPKDYRGQFFEVEDYLLSHHDYLGFRDRFIRIILKIMCYYPVSVYWGEWVEQLTPKQIVEMIDTVIEKHSRDLNMLFTGKEILIQFGWDSLHISVYNPDAEVCKLLGQIAASEGMFWRKAE